MRMESIKEYTWKIRSMIDRIERLDRAPGENPSHNRMDLIPEDIVKPLESMYFCACALRNSIAAAIDSLQLQIQLKNKTFPEVWADDTVYNSSASMDSNGIITIHIPESLPKYSKEFNLAFRKRWQGYIYRALKKLKAEHGRLPQYINAMVVIEVHSPAGRAESYKWDTSNRTYNLVINALNGILFPDDSAQHLTFAISGVYDENRYTLVYICDFERHLHSILQILSKPALNTQNN